METTDNLSLIFRGQIFSTAGFGFVTRPVCDTFHWVIEVGRDIYVTHKVALKSFVIASLGIPQ